MSVVTIAAIQICNDTNSLLVKPIQCEHQLAATYVLHAISDSPSYKTSACGSISTAKLVELLGTIQE